MGHNNFCVQEDLVQPLVTFLNHLKMNLQSKDTRDTSVWLKEEFYFPSNQIIEWEKSTFKGESEVWQLAARFRNDLANNERKEENGGFGRSC